MDNDDVLASFVDGSAFQGGGSSSGGGGGGGLYGGVAMPSPRAVLRGPFAVGQRVEALLGPARVCTGGVVLGDHGGGVGTYRVRFDDGLEFPEVHEGLLCREVSRVAELEEQLAQLQWRKMQNDAQIRAALEHTRLLARFRDAN